MSSDARGVLHVDAHEDAPSRRVGDHGREERPAEVEVDLEPERCELHRDVRVEMVCGDRVEGSVVRGRDRLGLGSAVHLLSEHVDRGQLPVGVQARRPLPSVVERRPRDVRRGQPLHDRPGHSREEPNESPIRDAHSTSILRRPPLRPSVVHRRTNRRRRRCRAARGAAALGYADGGDHGRRRARLPRLQHRLPRGPVRAGRRRSRRRRSRGSTTAYTPPSLAGPLYPEGIPIRPEEELAEIVRAEDVDRSCSRTRTSATRT